MDSPLSRLAQFNLCAGSAGTRPPRLLSGGSRRAPTSASTSTRLSPSLFRSCTDVFSAHHLRLNSDMQELPNEVREEYLRRATLLLENFGHAHVSHAGGQHAGGQHAGQVENTLSSSFSTHTSDERWRGWHWGGAGVGEAAQLRLQASFDLMSLLNLFTMFKLFTMFNLLNLFKLFNMFNAGSTSEGRTLGRSWPPWSLCLVLTWATS